MNKQENATFESSILDMIIVKNQVNLDKLCAGICSSRYLYYVINSERVPDYSIVKRIMERLEYDIWDHETYLTQDEYDRELLKNDILVEIVNNDFVKANNKLQAFSTRFANSNAIEKQFAKVMQYQIGKIQGITIENLRNILDEAINLTIPIYTEDDIESYYFSITEINLLVERLTIGINTKSSDYQILIRYIENRRYDEPSMVKVYPKLTYYYITSLVREGKRIEKEWLYCEKAIDILRNQNKLYYLWELLSLKSELEKNEDALCWKETLEKVYLDTKINPSQSNFCYLYFTQQIYSLNEVICDRRKVLGISQAKLCKDICSLRTLQRIEAKKTSPQREVAIALLQRLGLTTYFFHQEFLLDSTKLKGEIEKWRKVSNEQKFDKEKEIFDLILQYTLDNSYNKQSILCEEYFLKWKRENLDTKQFINSIVNVLEQTVSYKTLKKGDLKYLTLNELSCLNMLVEAVRDDIHEHKILLESLSNYFTNVEDSTSYFQVATLYDWIMCNVASEYGNIGEFAKSDKINYHVLKNSILMQNAKKISKIYYASWWNESETNKEKNKLLLAYNLAELFKHTYDINIIKKHLGV